MLDAKIASALNKMIQNSHFKKKVSLEERDDNVQEFDTRWDEGLLSMLKFQSDDVRESLYWLRIRESDQLKTVFGIVRHGDSSQDIDAQLSEIENDGEEKCKSETSIANFWRLARENRDRSSGQESRGNEWRWPVFEGRQMQFPARVTSVYENRHRNPPQLLSYQWHEVKVCREKGVSEAKVILAWFFDNRADTIWKVLVPCEYWHPPECQFYSFQSGCKAGDKCPFPHYKIDEQPKKRPKRATIPTQEEKAKTKVL